MIEIRFNELRKKKAKRDKRPVSLRAVSHATGIALSTIQRLNTGKVDGLRLSTIDRLCEYFALTNVGELIEYRQE